MDLPPDDSDDEAKIMAFLLSYASGKDTCEYYIRRDTQRQSLMKYSGALIPPARDPEFLEELEPEP